MALEDTMVLYQSSGDGPFGSVLVPRNSAWLNAKLDSEDTTWALLANDKDHLDCPFVNTQNVYIGLEKILVGDPPQTNITKAQGGTSDDDHPKNGLVMPDPAAIPASAEILDITVAAPQNGLIVSAIRCVSMPGPGMFIIDINGTIVGTPITSLDHQEAYWVWTGSALATDDVITVSVFNYYVESLFRVEVIV